VEFTIGPWVFVGGGISVGGTFVSVGGGTLVGGSVVAVGGGSVRVGGTGVGGSVGVKVGRGVFVRVNVGGTGVFVRVGGGGMGVRVRVGTRVTVAGSRVRRGSVGVIVTSRLGVSDGCGVRDGDSVPVGSTLGVAVGTKAVTTCSVRAAAVSRLENARSTRFKGAIVTEMARFKSPIAMADTLHNRLSPIAPAARIPMGPE
jgi:hypothetical protein